MFSRNRARRTLTAAIKRWDAISRLTTPSDHEAAEAALAQVYEAYGWEPARARWVASPLELARLSVERGPKAFHPHPENVMRTWSTYRALDRSLAQCGIELKDDVRDLLSTNSVWSDIEEDALKQLRKQRVSEETLIALFGGSLERDGSPYADGARITHWLNACAAYETLERLGAQLEPQIAPLLELSAYCGYFALGHEEALLGERPLVLSIGTHVVPDSPPALHAQDGPAYRFADGFEGHYLHGVAPESLALYREALGAT